MNYSLDKKKQLVGHCGAIKWLLPACLLAFIIAAPVSADYSTSFDGYASGTEICSEEPESWSEISGVCYSVISGSDYVSFPNSLSGYFLFSGFAATGDVKLTFEFRNFTEFIAYPTIYGGEWLFEVFFGGDGKIDLNNSYGSYGSNLLDYSTSSWNSFEADIDLVANNFRVGINDIFTGYFNFPFAYGTFQNFFGNTSAGFIDNISILTGADCGDLFSWNTCQNVAGCCWYQLPIGLSPDSYCEKCDVGNCASGANECGNCLDQESCENQEYCYWKNGICKYGVGTCQAGIGLQFCETEESCAGAAGFWYDSFCWGWEKELFTQSWEDYFAIYGETATATIWVGRIATSTENFLGKMGGIMTGFSGSWDLIEAENKGAALGSIIPKARGFLSILDKFLGNLPIGELFVFTLIIMIAVGIFRLVRNLWSVLKFW